MKIYVFTNSDGTINGWGSTFSEGSVEIEIDDTHEILTTTSRYFRLVDGILVKDENLVTSYNTRRSNQSEIRELKQLLSDTDFYYIRKMEENTAVPSDVVTKRIEARKRLRELGL